MALTSSSVTFRMLSSVSARKGETRDGCGLNGPDQSVGLSGLLPAGPRAAVQVYVQVFMRVCRRGPVLQLFFFFTFINHSFVFLY